MKPPIATAPVPHKTRPKPSGSAGFLQETQNRKIIRSKSRAPKQRFQVELQLSAYFHESTNFNITKTD